MPSLRKLSCGRGCWNCRVAGIKAGCNLDIVVVGSVALDSVETPERRVKDVLGGSAVYFAWAASYFSRAGIVGIIGDDFPVRHIELLKSRSVDLEGLKKSAGRTFHWVGKYGSNPNERETLSVCLNVFEGFRPELPPQYRSADYVFLANIDPDLHLEVLSQLENPKLIAGDTMDIWIETKRPSLMKALKKIEIMILNDSEVRQLTGETNLIKAGRALLSLGPGTVIVKRGENGALLIGEDFLFSIPAYPVENVIDPTGAGDAFAGGVIGSLARAGAMKEENLRSAVVCGSVVASFCVEDFSLDRLRAVSEEDIMSRIEEFRHLTDF